MKVLLVNNGTHYRKRLLNLLSNFDVTEVSFKELEQSNYDGFDLVVLSGAYRTYDVKNFLDSIYIREKKLITSAKVPVIGLCLGAQLIAYTYGAHLSTIQGGKVKGLKRIWNVRKTPFDFFRYYGGRVWASQKWRITELPEELEAWCASGDGVEVFKHKKRPLYGLQFHPEYHSVDNDGGRIFNRIIELEFGRAKTS
jgi:GMP synthase (glutamine-hydrolysing)